MDIKKEWFSLSEKYSSDNFIYSDIFIQIYRNYSKKNRFYHNINHIKELLSIIDSFKDKLINPESVKFSIWFHDVVYKAWRKDNEEKSSKFAYESMVKMRIDKKTIDKTCELILLTKGHSSKTNDFDTNIFLDSDLAILGSELDKYNTYCENIRKEYFFVPKNIYKKGRIAVLESFLSMENIYKTSEMQNKYEIQARKNIIFELDKLKS
jgi:predicted metal-dependent HD superfamily phosphohydrolase